MPETRENEDFWSILKGEVYKNSWKADNMAQLKERINYFSKKVDPNLIQKITEGVYRRLDRIRRNGLPEENKH